MALNEKQQDILKRLDVVQEELADIVGRKETSTEIPSHILRRVAELEATLYQIVVQLKGA